MMSRLGAVVAGENMATIGEVTMKQLLSLN